MILGCCRFDLAFKFTNTFLVQKSRPFLQRTCFLFHALDISNTKAAFSLYHMKTLANPKILTTPVWTPVSTRANFSEDCLMNDQVSAKLDVDNQVGQVQDIMSASVSDDQRPCVQLGAVNEVVASKYTSSSASKKDDERQLLAEGSVPSGEKHSIRIEAAAPLIRFIREKENSTRKKIEEEIGVKIIFPLGKKDEYIIIEGISAECVTTASEKLQILIKEAIKSPSLNYTHFVSLPLAIHPQLVEKLFNFQNSILGISSKNEITCLGDDNNEDTSDEESREIRSDKAPVAVNLKAEEGNNNPQVGSRNIPLVSYPPKALKPSKMDEKTSALSALGIDKSIFINPKTFHLTVLMLKLYNKDLVDAAANVLQSLSSKIMHALDGQPVVVRLKGLDCMRGSFAKARVIYAPVEVIGGEDRLLHACQVITDAFTEAGLVLEKDAHQKLKLHATLMNASHRKRNKYSRRANTFDARGIVEQFGSEEWGEYLIREAHLSRRFVYDKNGYYQCRSSIPFPNKCE